VVGVDPVGPGRDGLPAAGAPVGGGTIDALAEQVVAGADQPGDVLVLCGTTLITWGVVEGAAEVDGLWTVPHTAAGMSLVGGPSNAGGLFLNWASHLLDAGDATAAAPDDVPIWVPYPRGERVPFQDSARRAELVDLNLMHTPASVRRAAFEASGFVARRMIEASPVPAQRIVATGGGIRVDGWIEALADCTRLPVHVCAIPEGGALGAAFLARLAAGLETSMADAARWARTARIVEPDPTWARHVEERYARFTEVAG
jgi:xylulokinase